MPRSPPALRRLARADFALLARWLGQPHVARWWNHETSAKALERDFGACIDGDDPAEVFIASIAGTHDDIQNERPVEVSNAPLNEPADPTGPTDQRAPGTSQERPHQKPRGTWPIGLIQRYTFADNPGYIDELAPLLAVPGEALSMDYFIGEPAALRRGLGSAMLQAALHSTWRDYPAAPAVIVPVSAANTASWRLLERVGFRCVACGPLTPDNPVDDPLHHVYQIDRP